MAIIKTMVSYEAFKKQCEVILDELKPISFGSDSKEQRCAIMKKYYAFCERFPDYHKRLIQEQSISIQESVATMEKNYWKKYGTK